MIINGVTYFEIKHHGEKVYNERVLEGIRKNTSYPKCFQECLQSEEPLLASSCSVTLRDGKHNLNNQAGH